ncbi:MAG TPA: hypothetical protein VN749_06525 [Candidatus Eisenbacteria bacterium]|nr:hypothetical protein [Candidatus Eisenbacteria bacterium]
MTWKLSQWRWATISAAAIGLAGMVLQAADAQQSREESRPPVTSVDRIPQEARENAQPNTRATYPADGRQQAGLPLEAYAVVPGTRVLVRLENELDTGVSKQGLQFKVRTLEPLEAGSGIYLPAGAQITGHVSRVDPAGVAGRAKIWLVFDEIRTRFGPLPIVADVVGVPGDHSVKMTPEKEGMLESKTSTQQASGQAAAEGAGQGAIRGIKDKNAKEAAEYAAVAALEAYLMEAGRGHEMNLPKGSKLELELERALYLVRE